MKSVHFTLEPIMAHSALDNPFTTHSLTFSAITDSPWIRSFHLLHLYFKRFLHGRALYNYLTAQPTTFFLNHLRAGEELSAAPLQLLLQACLVVYFSICRFWVNCPGDGGVHLVSVGVTLATALSAVHCSYILYSILASFVCGHKKRFKPGCYIPDVEVKENQQKEREQAKSCRVEEGRRGAFKLNLTSFNDVKSCELRFCKSSRGTCNSLPCLHVFINLILFFCLSPSHLKWGGGM